MQNCCLLVMLRPFVIPNIEHRAQCWKCVGLNKVVWICVVWSWHWRGCIMVTVKMEARTLTCCDSPLSGWTGWMPVSSPEKLVYFHTQRMEQHSIPSVCMMGWEQCVGIIGTCQRFDSHRCICYVLYSLESHCKKVGEAWLVAKIQTLC